MSSLKKLKSSTRVAIVVMSFHVQLVVEKGATAAMLFDSLTRVILTQQAIFFNMLEFAGVLKWWVEAATATKDFDAVCEVLGKTKLLDGLILAEF
jgi:hypothetical protein